MEYHFMRWMDSSNGINFYTHSRMAAQKSIDSTPHDDWVLWKIQHYNTLIHYPQCKMGTHKHEGKNPAITCYSRLWWPSLWRSHAKLKQSIKLCLPQASNTFLSLCGEVEHTTKAQSQCSNCRRHWLAKFI